MKIEQFDSELERSVLVGMIVDKTVLSKIGSKWNGTLFASSYANLVASWCVDYYRRFNDAPRRSIESIYKDWSFKNDNDTQSKIVYGFLSGLSSEYENTEINSDFLIDRAGLHFNYVRLNRLKEEIDSKLSSRNIEEAEKLITEYSKIEIGAGSGIDLFIDQQAVEDTFNQDNSKPFIEYPGDLGIFLQNSLQRDCFVAWFGQDKSGKSFILLDLAWRAMLQRRKVAYFEVGDMSERQVKSRFMVRAAKHPIRAKGGWPYTFQYPVSIVPQSDGTGIATTKSKTFDKPLDRIKAWEKCCEVMKTKVKSNKSYFRLSCHPNSSINVMGIESILDSWEREGWVPDVIVIDYADILSPPSGKLEYREQINTTWKQMRALSQKKHCLVATVSQSDSEVYDKKLMTKRNFSEDKRKLAHVTALYGINQTDGEKNCGLVRWNCLVLRDGSFNVKDVCFVAGCLDLANPIIKTCLGKRDD